jgi:hypothetical protein
MSVNPNTGIKGMDIVLANLNREIMAMENRTLAGLIKAAALIRDETETGDLLTPVDLGNLRASWFVVTATSIPVGQGVSNFKGPKAGEIAANHSSTLAEAQGFVAANTPKKGKFIIIGYTVNYAMYVHENLGMHDPANPYWKDRKWREGSGPKWFEAAIKKKASRILEIIRDNAKIGG